MKPGRDLDALVAEKVMGYVPGSCSCMDLCKVAYLKIRPSGAYEMVGCIHKLPNYSTDISAAWEVVEKIYDYNFRLERFESLNDDYYGVQFLVDGRWVYSEAETVPHAICLASLAAVGIKL